MQGHELLDGTAPVAVYRDAARERKLQLHLIVRKLRPPTDEERRAIINGIELRHRSLLWSIMSRSANDIHYTSRDCQRKYPHQSDYCTPSPEYDIGPLPDIVTMLLLAMCDPNDQGAPPRSPLEVVIRRDEAHLVELLLQPQAHPQLREPEHCRL